MSTSQNPGIIAALGSDLLKSLLMNPAVLTENPEEVIEMSIQYAKMFLNRIEMENDQFNLQNQFNNGDDSGNPPSGLDS